MTYQEQLLHLRFTTEARYTHKIFDILEELLDIVNPTSQERKEFLIALGEALDNAITHGNKLDKNKFVEIECIITVNKITCRIKDEGQGFNYKPCVQQADQSVSADHLIQKTVRGRPGGLGMRLIKKCADEIYFNETGNEVCIIKSFGSSRGTSKVRHQTAS